MVSGCLVKTDAMEKSMVVGDGSNKYEVKLAPKTKELISALLKMHIYADDLFVYRGTVLSSMMREEPYTLFVIPRLGKQIAVCDQIGNATFISNAIKPLHFWTTSSKQEMQADEDIAPPIRYDHNGKYLSKICDLLLGDGITEVSANRFPKTPIPKASKKPLLTDEYILHLLDVFYEKEGRYFSVKDERLWDKDTYGKIIALEDDSGKKISNAFLYGLRGLSHWRDQKMTLPKFAEINGRGIRRYGESRPLTDERIIQLLDIFYEYTLLNEGKGRYFSDKDKFLWDKDSDGNFVILAKETYATINTALAKGGRGLSHWKGQKMTLPKFAEINNRGISNKSEAKHLTDERISHLFKVFYEYTLLHEGKGRYFSDRARYPTP